MTWISKERVEFLQSIFPGMEKVGIDHPTCLECTMELDMMRKVMDKRKQQKVILSFLNAGYFQKFI